MFTFTMTVISHECVVPYFCRFLFYKAGIINACVAKSKGLFIKMENSVLDSNSARTWGF